MVLYLVLVLLCPFLFCNHHDGKEKAGCFISIVILVFCHCKCSMAFFHGAVGCSVVYDCGVS